MFGFIKKSKLRKMEKQSKQSLSLVWNTLKEWELQSGMEGDNIQHQIVDGIKVPKGILEIFDKYCDTQDMTGRGYAPSFGCVQEENHYEVFFFPLFIVCSTKYGEGQLGYYIFARKDRDQTVSKLNLAFLESVSFGNPQELVFGLRKCMFNSRLASRANFK
jgi:hypothetical protein